MMRKKLNVVMHAYRIRGACNPKIAYEAMGIEPRVGAIDPVASMQASFLPGTGHPISRP